MQLTQSGPNILCIVESTEDLDQLSQLALPPEHQLAIIHSEPGREAHQITVSSQRELSCVIFGMFLSLSLSTQTLSGE